MNYFEKKTGFTTEYGMEIFQENLTREELVSLYQEGIEERIGDVLALRELKDEILNNECLHISDCRELIAYIKRRLAVVDHIKL